MVRVTVFVLAISAGFATMNARAAGAGDTGTSAGTAATTATTSGGYEVVGFDVLGSYEYPEEGVNPPSTSTSQSLIPQRVHALDGRRVEIQGFMIPLDSSEGKVSTFLLQGNQMQCCYGVPPKINEVVLVRTKQEGFTYAADTPIKASGTLHVGEIRDQGSLIGLYALDAVEISD